LRMLRVTNTEVHQSIDSVLEAILSALRSPHPNPLPEGEGTGPSFEGEE
jgi:hypothetical protein